MCFADEILVWYTRIFLQSAPSAFRDAQSCSDSGSYVRQYMDGRVVHVCSSMARGWTASSSQWFNIVNLSPIWHIQGFVFRSKFLFFLYFGDALYSRGIMFSGIKKEPKFAKIFSSVSRQYHIKIYRFYNGISLEMISTKSLETIWGSAGQQNLQHKNRAQKYCACWGTDLPTPSF